nr:hypothetical protein [uncultured Cohaesibacter sp.]
MSVTVTATAHAQFARINERHAGLPIGHDHGAVLALINRTDQSIGAAFIEAAPHLSHSNARNTAQEIRLSLQTIKFALGTFLCSITHIGNQALEMTLEFVARPRATA